MATINRVILYNRKVGNVHRLQVDSLDRWVSAVLAEYHEQRNGGLCPHVDAVRATVAAARDWKFTVTDSEGRP